MTQKYKPGSPTNGPVRAAAPMTTPGNTRSFDMRPKSTDYVRRTDPRDRAIRPADQAPDALLDPDPAE